MSIDDDIDARLERLRRATEGIRPSPGFEARAEQALSTPAVVPRSVFLSPPARRFLSMAALAAVAAIAWGVRGEVSMDDALAASYGAVDFDGE